MRRMRKLVQVLPRSLARYRSMRASRHSLPEPAFWQMTASATGHLEIGGFDCASLADTYATPLHVVDAGLLRKSYTSFLAAFARQGVRCEAFYSYKTNPVPAILSLIHEAGAGAEVTSPFELWLAIEAGVRPDRIILNGPGKDPEVLRTAIQHGIRRIHLNSLDELERIEVIAEELDKVPSVGLRVSMGRDWGGKFGFGEASGEADRALERLARSRRVRLDGLHAHIGTCLHTPELHQGAVRALARLLLRAKSEFGLELPALDIGGGFGVPAVRQMDRIDYWLQRWFRARVAPAHAGTQSSIDEIAAHVVETLRSYCERHGVDLPLLELEPGRIVTSSAQVLLTRITEIKPGAGGISIAVLDAGTNLAAPLAWEVHEVLPATKVTEPHTTPYSLVGPICTPADQLTSIRYLPRLEPGDLIAIMDAGAYFTSFERAFSFPRPPVVLVDDGEHRLVRTRESFEGIVARDRRFGP